MWRRHGGGHTGLGQPCSEIVRPVSHDGENGAIGKEVGDAGGVIGKMGVVEAGVEYTGRHVAAGD